MKVKTWHSNSCSANQQPGVALKRTQKQISRQPLTLAKNHSLACNQGLYILHPLGSSCIRGNLITVEYMILIIESVN